MNKGALYIKLMSKMSKQASTQVIYPQKKPSNTLRNIGYGLAGAAALGAGAYGMHRAGMFNGLGKDVAKPTPTPTPTPKPFIPEQNRGVTDRVNRALSGHKTESTYKQDYPGAPLPYEAGYEKYLDSQPEPSRMDKIMAPINKVTTNPWLHVGANPILSTAAKYSKTVAPAANIAKKHFPYVGGPAAIYSNFKNDSLSDFWMNQVAGVDPTKHHIAKNILQGTIGVGEAGLLSSPYGLLSLPVAGVEYGTGMADDYLKEHGANADSYRNVMQELSKTISSKDPRIAQSGMDSARNLLAQHSDKMDALANPTGWERLKGNYFNMGTSGLIPGYGAYKTLKSSREQLSGRDTDGGWNGATELQGYRDILHKKMLQHTNQRMLANQSS